jgi:hypothetical protein
MEGHILEFGSTIRLISQGEYPRALISFTKLAAALEAEESESPLIIRRLLKIVWEEVCVSIEERMVACVDDIDDELHLHQRTKRSGHALEVTIEQMERLMGEEEILAQHYMLEWWRHQDRMLRIFAGTDPYTPYPLLDISDAFTRISSRALLH